MGCWLPGVRYSPANRFASWRAFNWNGLVFVLLTRSISARH